MEAEALSAPNSEETEQEIEEQVGVEARTLLGLDRRVRRLEARLHAASEEAAACATVAESLERSVGAAADARAQQAAGALLSELGWGLQNQLEDIGRRLELGCERRLCELGMELRRRVQEELEERVLQRLKTLELRVTALLGVDARDLDGKDLVRRRELQAVEERIMGLFENRDRQKALGCGMSNGSSQRQEGLEVVRQHIAEAEEQRLRAVVQMSPVAPPTPEPRVEEAQAAAPSAETPVAEPQAEEMTWTVWLDKRDRDPLGVDLDSATLDVEGIAQRGLLDAWNAEHPRSAVRVGDRLLKVNGQREPTCILDECGKPQVLEMTFARAEEATQAFALDRVVQQVRRDTDGSHCSRCGIIFTDDSNFCTECGLLRSRGKVQPGDFETKAAHEALRRIWGD